MQVKNGIIIDGVLHELRESKSKDCKQCSLLHVKMNLNHRVFVGLAYSLNQ